MPRHLRPVLFELKARLGALFGRRWSDGSLRDAEVFLDKVIACPSARAHAFD